MKIVRARPKIVDDLPEWVKCCQDAVNEITALGDVVVDLDDRRDFSSAVCRYCGHLYTFESLVTVKVLNTAYHSPLDYLDLDEGPLPT